MNGIINVYKEKGYTSFDVVAKLRGILRMKRIGHTGTLDPDAEGVLPVCIGNAAGLSEFLAGRVKTYEAVIKLGLITDTQDITGKVLEERPLCVSRGEFIDAVMSFIGEYDQVPPMYSAIKINGRKLYELAREGREIDRPARKVMIHSIEIFNIKEEGNFVSEASIRVSCSKGTYIRTLCQDIGVKLSQGACMKSLLRIQSGDFMLKDSRRLAEVEYLLHNDRIGEILIPVERILPYRSLIVNEEYNKYLVNGNKLKPCYACLAEGGDDIIKPSELFKVYDYMNRFMAVYRYDNDEMLYRPYKMFFDSIED